MLAIEDRINRARILLERKGVVPTEFLNAQVRDSWVRCLDSGLDPLGEPDRVMVEPDRYAALREENDEVLHLAMIEMQNLHSQISGSNFAIVFANRDGVILESVSDESFATTPDAARIAPGNVWSEIVNGTNALGEVVHSRRPSIVHAGEHFFRRYSGLTCVAAPVFDPRGDLAGVIDATSDCRSRQQHTLALVKMSSLTVENGLFRRAFRDKLIIELHNRHEFLGTLQAGMLALDEDGFLIAANRQARFLLQGISLEPKTPFEEVFRVDFRTFAGARDGRYGEVLTDVHGSSFAVKASGPAAFDRPRRRDGESALRPARKPAATPRMVCVDPAVRLAVKQVEQAARISVPVHIRGETGTGKELLARHAHAASGRTGEFVAVNCAALPETLIESELFGYRSGAFTGASRDGAVGLVQRADGGTLFLDEIGDMPMRLQATLLRFLDGWRIRPVGETREREVDTQLIVATNNDLEEAVRAKRFRADLLYRINTIEVVLPPLRERSDMREIVAAILDTFDRRPELEAGAVDLLKGYGWPGNIRELRSFLIRLAIDASDGLIGPERVRELLDRRMSKADGRERPASLRDRQRDIVLAAYERHKGNVSAVARELGISRNSVYKRLKEASARRGKA